MFSETYFGILISCKTGKFAPTVGRCLVLAGLLTTCRLVHKCPHLTASDNAQLSGYSDSLRKYEKVIFKFTETFTKSDSALLWQIAVND